MAAVVLLAVLAAAYSLGPSSYVEDSNAEVGRSVWQGHAAAFGGGYALAAWADMRELNDPNRCNIWGTRVAPDGGVVDRTGIAIGGPAGAHRNQPAVAFGGGQWLVAWTDRRAGNEDIYAARVSAGGAVLDPTGLPVATTLAPERGPAVSFDGTHFLVAWEVVQPDAGVDLVLAGVRPDGAVEAPFWANAAAGDQRTPRVACSAAANCLLAWEDQRASPSDLYTARVQGSVVAPAGGAPLALPGGQGPLAVAYDGLGDQFVLAWHDTRDPAAEEIRAGRVSSAGVVLNTGVVVATGNGARTAPSVACQPGVSQCLIGWQETTATAWDVMSARFDSASDVVLDAPPVQHTTDPRYQSDPAVAWLGSGSYLIAFFDNAWPGNDNSRGVRVDTATGSAREAPFFISTAYARQLHPAIASDGVTVLVAWLQRRDGLYYARLRSLEADGRPLGQSMALRPSGTLGYVGTYVTPSLAPSIDGEYLVAWSHADFATSRFDVFAQRATAQGLLDDAGVLLSSGAANATGPSAAWDGTRYVVVFDDRRSGDWDIWGMRVSQAGALLDPGGRPLVVQSRSQLNPELACHSSGSCLMLWGDQRDAGYAVMAATLDPATMALGTAVELEPSASSEYFDVAAGTSGYVAAWSRVVGTGDLDVRGARLTTAGTVIDVGGLPIGETGTYEYDPAVAFDGADFHVVFSHEVAGYDQTVVSRFTWTGQVDPTPSVLAAAPSSWQSDGRLALAPGGQLLLAWTQYVDPDRHTWQVSVRQVAPGDGGVTPVDAGTGDAGASDAGSGVPDGGTTDAGAADGGGGDGGVSDGGDSDGGDSDGGAPDGGAPDGGASDGGASDGGASDGGASDAGGASPDSGAVGDDAGLGPRVYRVGCDCDAAGGAPALLAVWLAVLFGASHRRRRRDGADSAHFSGR